MGACNCINDTDLKQDLVIRGGNNNELGINPIIISASKIYKDKKLLLQLRKLQAIFKGYLCRRKVKSINQSNKNFMNRHDYGRHHFATQSKIVKYIK